MSRKNYSKISTQAITDDATEQIVEKVEEELNAQINEQPAETEVPATVNGRVINCGRLNIRSDADAASKVLCVVDVGSIVTVNSETLPHEWFSVITADGIEGFCMSKFIAIDQ